jgi:multidrug efflux pump subunit AcrB
MVRQAVVKKLLSPPVFFPILLLLCLPGTARLRSTAPPLPEGEYFTCRQPLPGYTLDQSELWVRPLEQMLLSLPGTGTVESRMEAGKAAVSVRHKTGRTSTDFTPAIDRITESCSRYLPEGTLPVRFSRGSSDDLPLFIFLFESEEGARRGEEVFGKIRGAGTVTSSAAQQSRTAAAGEPSADNPFPCISLVSSTRQGTSMGLQAYGSRSGEKTDTVHLNGLPVTALTIGKGRRDIIELHEDVIRAAARLEQEGIPVLTLYDAGRMRIKEINETVISILTGFLLVGMILHIRHRNIRVSLSLLGILPAGMLPALALAGYLRMPLNLLTLSAFACCTGTVADAAVLILEELQGQWKGGRDAALTGTLTTIAAFLPLPFLPSGLSFMIADYALIITVALSCALFYSLAVLPSMLPEQPSSSSVIPAHSLRPASVPKIKRKALLSSAVALTVLPCVALLVPGSLSFSYYGKRTAERLDFRVEYPLDFPASSMDKKLEEMETAIMALPGLGPFLISWNERKLDASVFPRKDREGWDTEAIRTLIELHAPGDPGVLMFPAESDMESAFSVFISGEGEDERDRLSRSAASRLRDLLPDSRIYFSEMPPRRIIEVRIDLQKAGVRGLSPSMLSNELAWRLGGGVIERESGEGRLLIEPARLDKLDTILSPYSDMVDYSYALRKTAGYRRNGRESIRIICTPQSSRREEREAIKTFSGWAEEAGKGGELLVETAPDRRRAQKLTIQAAAGAASSLLAVFLLLLVRYGQTDIPLMMLFPMFTSIAWPLAILAAGNIPLTIPGTGALFFAAGLSVNTGVLLLPPGSRFRESRPLPLASLILPALSTWAGTAPLLAGSSAALQDVPVILASASLFGTLSAVILYRLRTQG